MCSFDRIVFNTGSIYVEEWYIVLIVNQLYASISWGSLHFGKSDLKVLILNKITIYDISALCNFSNKICIVFCETNSDH